MALAIRPLEPDPNSHRLSPCSDLLHLVEQHSEAKRKRLRTALAKKRIGSNLPKAFSRTSDHAKALASGSQANCASLNTSLTPHARGGRMRSWTSSDRDSCACEDTHCKRCHPT